MEWIQSNFEFSIFKILSNKLKQNSSPPLSALVGGFFKQKIERKTPRMRREERVNRVVCKAFQVKLSSTIIPRGLVLLATFRLEYEDDYEYEFKVLSTRTSKIFALQA